MRVLVCEEFNANVKCNCCDGVKLVERKGVVIHALFAVLGGSLVTSP